MGKLDLYNRVSSPPREALKPINGGRNKGKSGINSQWRIKALTEEFGPCGQGWYYEPISEETINVDGGRVVVKVKIALYVKYGEDWSQPIPGIGGSFLVQHETKGIYIDDDAFKKATTDALSVAMKQLGVAGKIYEDKWHDNKYIDDNSFDLKYNPDKKTLMESKTMEKLKENWTEIYRGQDTKGRTALTPIYNDRKRELLDGTKNA